MLINNTNDLERIRSEINNETIGFVATMGNLHTGHLSLIKESLENNDITFVSIFVNPKQFGPYEDFEKYPRTLEEDLDKINELKNNKKIWVYAPHSVDEIFPPDWDLKIDVPELSNKLCGKSRPTHFSGVCTVVYRLLSLIRPSVAYFGQKDYQQCLIIKKMVDNLSLPVKIEILPISREKNGFALSSRNQFLDKAQRKEALELNKTLNNIKELISINGLNAYMQPSMLLINEKLNDKRWEYLQVLDSLNLMPPTKMTNEIVILGALKIKQTRLIDNLVFKC